MRKRNTTGLASLRRSMALVFRFSLLAAIWHAPLPTFHWHAEADDHNTSTLADNPSHAANLEIEFLLPCHLNGCEDSSHPDRDESESDHPTHIATVGYGVIGDTKVDLIDTSIVDQNPGSHSSVAAIANQQSTVSCASLFEVAHLTAGAAAPSLPLRANLQVFRI